MSIPKLQRKADLIASLKMGFFLVSLRTVCLHVCLHVWVHVGCARAHVGAFMWRSEVDPKCFPHSLSEPGDSANLDGQFAPGTFSGC